MLQIQDLNLDNCRATQIDGLTDEFTNLTTLSLINVGLTTLKGFPNLPALRKVAAVTVAITKYQVFNLKVYSNRLLVPYRLIRLKP